MAITKMPDGQYRIDFRDANGRRYRKLYDTFKAADVALASVKTKISTGDFLAPKSVPNFDRIAREWLASRSNRRAAVVDNYRRHVELYCLPRLGNIRLDRIDVK